MSPFMVYCVVLCGFSVFGVKAQTSSVEMAHMMRTMLTNSGTSGDVFKDRENTSSSNEFDSNFRESEVILGAMPEGQCKKDVGVLLESIKQKRKWAMQLYDSSVKSPSGILFGAYYQLGNFDECVSALQPHDQTIGKSVPINGKYCLADISAQSEYDKSQIAVSSYTKRPYRGNLNATLHWAICIPSACTHKDVKQFLETLFNATFGKNVVSVNVDAKMCYTERSLPFTTFEIVYGSILGVFFILIASATFYHSLNIWRVKRCISYSTERERNGKRESVTYQYIMCFSLIQNVKQIFVNNPNDLDCIAGMKVLSMVFIIGAHGLLYIIGGPVMNKEFYDQAILSVESAIFLNGTLLVDTFLLLSGFLMCHSLLMDLERRKGKINLWKIYAGRYIRLTPAYAAVIGFYCTFFVRFSNGPLWNSKVALERERCLKSWWANLLYVNNYVNTEHLCMFQSWNLAADTQLFMIAPILIYPLWKWRKLGEILLGFVLSGTIIIPFVYTYVNQLDPTFMAYAPEVVDLNTNFYFVTAYIKTHMHAISYFLGLLFGYVIHKQQSSGTKLSPKAVVFGWAAATMCAVFSMFTVILFFSPDHEYNVLEASVYGSLHRVAWCLAVGWVLFCCVTDNAALVNNCLSWKILLPFSKLTYCCYLVNGIVVLYFSGTVRNPVHLGVVNLLSILISQIAITVALATIVCVLFEFPFNGVKKLLLKKSVSKVQDMQVHFIDFRDGKHDSK